MKTTKKIIASTLRSMDSTAIFALYKKMHGEINRSKIYAFIQENAPSLRVEKSAYKIAYRRNRDKNERYAKVSPFHRAEVVRYLKEQCSNPSSNYAKRPMLGDTHLYFCSPAYGHRDYNKWRALPIKGNERFCEVVIKYADKFFAPIYNG